MRDETGDERTSTAIGERTSVLSPTEAFEVVANERRRRLLSYFLSQSRSVAQTEELLEHLREQETGSSPNHEALAVAVEHQHLPLLVEKDLVEVDARSGFVRYWGDPLVESCLELADRWESSRTE